MATTYSSRPLLGPLSVGPQRWAQWCTHYDGFGPYHHSPTTNPLAFTQCFYIAIVYNIPFAFLLLASALSLFTFLATAHRAKFGIPTLSSISSARHLAAKLTINTLLASIESGSHLLASGSFDSVPLAFAIFHILVLGLAFTLTCLNHANHRRSSDILLITWFLFIISSAVGIYLSLDIFPKAAPTDSTTNVYNLVHYILTCSFAGIAFFLELTPKRPDTNHDDDDERAPLLLQPQQPTVDPLEAPETTANIFSRLSFWWLSPILRTARRHSLSPDLLWHVPVSEITTVWYTKFTKCWARVTLNSPERIPADQFGYLMKTCVYTFGPYFAWGFLFKFVQDVLQYAQPQLLRYLINYETPSQGITIALAMLFTSLTQSIFVNQYFHICFTVGLRIRAALSAAIYHKCLRLSLSAKSSHSSGQLTSFLTVDVQKLSDLCTYLHVLWSGPFQIAVALYCLFQQLGSSMIAGVAVMLLMFPINAKFAKRQQALQKDQARCRDQRLRFMDEFLAGIRVVKLYAWEMFFLSRIDHCRQRELRNLKKYAYLSAGTSLTWNCTPFLVALASFTVFTLIQGNTLTPENTFVSLALFNLLQFPLSMFPNVISSLIEATVSIRRLHAYLVMPEVHAQYLHRNALPPSPSVAVEIKGSFGWSVSSQPRRMSGEFGDESGPVTPILKDLDLKILSQELTCIIGTIGAGKSSLLSAILGEMEAIPSPSQVPSVETFGRIAYVSDDAWILNSSIRDNILFGLDMDSAWYAQVLSATALDVDLESLPGGDTCLLGEQGVGLSGGQKKRLTIARAVYAQRDVYLLDNPMSALDVHVGRHVFEQCFGRNGLLATKCRILVTHQVNLLKESNAIVYMRHGQVTEVGTYASLVALGGDVAKMLAMHGETSAEIFSSRSSPVTIIEPCKSDQPTACLEPKPSNSINQTITPETFASGAVSWNVYDLYFAACRYKFVLIFIVASVMTQSLQIASNVWLEYVVSHHVDASQFLSIYAIIFLSYATCSVLATLTAWIFCGIRASHSLHDSMLSRLAAFPLSFFDTTPSGRVLNRFGKDTSVLDESIPRSMMAATRTSLVVIGVITLISSFQPLFLGVVIPLGITYKAIQGHYIPASRDIKRIESTLRSPIISHFCETVAGIHVIRAFQHQARFVKEFHARVDFAQNAAYLSLACNRWLASRLEWCGAVVVFVCAVLLVKSEASSSVIGLALSYALSVTGALNWSVRQFSEVETNIVAVERIAEYMGFETEAPNLLPTRPSALWPERGEIVFDNYSTRYRPGMDLVLHNISFQVKPGEKVGIVGRTGSGKSSLLLALFRAIEPASGSIRIDGIDTRQIGLYDLRSRLTIIPQEPLIFVGSVRQSLDPLGLHDDFSLWEVLEAIQLKAHVMQLPDKLSNYSHGSTFSLGQRQLICLARALLRQTQILVLDEATAQIDVETDAIIQRTIRDRFSHATVLTVAHRIGTILDSDRVLLMDNGYVREFDRPATLLGQEDSLFRKLVHESNLNEADDSSSRGNDHKD